MGWRFVCGMIGVMAAVTLVVLLLIKIPEVQKRQKDGKGLHASVKAFTYARYYVFLLIAFTYVAVETVMNGWITTYFQGTGILSHVEARIVLSLVWVSIMIGRITASAVGNKVKKEHIIASSALAVLVFTLILIQLDSFIGVALCVFALGLALSALLPTNIANAAIYGRGAGLAMGILLSAGGMGATVGPVVTGMVAERVSLSASMWAAVGFALVLLLAALVNLMFGRAQKTAG
jgi:fucose permease